MSRSWHVRQRQFYDRVAGSFDARGSVILRRENRNHLEKIETIANALHLSPNDQILEIGIGTGIHAAWILEKRRVTLVGIDLSSGMIRIAEARLRSTGNEGYHLIKGVGEALCFADGVFDACYCSGTLHHVESPLDVLREMVRVTKPGGYVAAMEPNWLFPVNTFAAAVQKQERNILMMRGYKLKRWGELTGLAHLEVTNVLYTPPVPEFLASLYEKVDSICRRIPVVRAFSIMLMLSGKKAGGEALASGGYALIFGHHRQGAVNIGD